MADREVQAVAFDVNETLFSLERLGSAFAGVGLDPATVPLWFARLLRDGFALTAIGQYRPFSDLAAQSLQALDPGGIDEAKTTAVLSLFRQLDPHPDVEPALQMLHDAGVPAVTLTNGSADLVSALLARAGLTSLVRRSLSVEQVRRWKPAPEPYQWAAAELGVHPSRLALVASHPWDCAGAHAAGLASGWVNRTGVAWPAVFTPPDVTGNDLSAVIAALLRFDQRQ